MFERLRAAINAALDAATADADPRSIASQMREAVLEAGTSVGAMRDGVERTERQLQFQRQQLADAERRGRLAAGIQDQETVEVAARFAAKHRERVEVLERKLEAQRSELVLAEREYGEMKTQLRDFVRTRAATDASRRVDAAWRDLEAAGGERPETDAQDEVLRSRLDRAAREALAEEQLQALKKKMGKS
ncbi:MAG: hypothetical protein GTN62_13935 [Gemmatimonadales bacterium]|nr:hypothetical protein [Gemmatimonadales bacterium]NIN13103.1 hypothetical protein [Gemmatimonadales bacterium]NIN51187.1 hypothetical protein [Gemmatimonadales bacterium]NIP08651.1 hypothetical protein [Gemmatimonadales bacterium]NIR02339.1 hypothetical protein [Gemmatimonadales bacterium]